MLIDREQLKDIMPVIRSGETFDLDRVLERFNIINTYLFHFKLD